MAHLERSAKPVTSTILNAIGLILNIVGVVIVFFFGFPQPTHEEGVSIIVEDGTRLMDGRTAAEHRLEVRQKKKLYLWMSRSALLLIVLGFGFQLWATFK